VLPAIEQGFYQSEISSAAYLYQRETDDNERVIVGVNGYVDEDEDLRIPILQMDPEGYDRQVNRLKQLRAERDNERVEQTLNALRNAAEGNDNTMPYILDAVRAYATLGEITDLFREVFGEYREPTWI
jgi:methylmalonyl-CoA mutase N-terminal domain/subunit